MNKAFNGKLLATAMAGATAAAMSLTAVPAYAELSYKEISTNANFARDKPRVDRDSKGNYHIVYRMGDVGAAINSGMSGSNVGYMMVSPSGQVLIDEVKLTTDGTTNIGTADVEVTSDDKVIVSYVFRTDRDLRLIKLDPSAAAQDGSAPALGSITDVAEVVVADTFYHPFIELDSSDNVFVWSHNGRFAKYDSSLVNVLAVSSPFSGPNRSGHGTNPIALDSDGNVHVVFQDCDEDLCPVSYGMIDGATGAVLIDQTPVATSGLTTAAGSDTVVDNAPHAAHYSIMVDGKDQVRVVWVDKRYKPVWDDYCEVCASGGTLVYSKLDPSLDDQSGDAADIDVIKTVGDVEVGSYKYMQAFLAKNGVVQVFHGLRGDLNHLRITSAGKASKSRHLTGDSTGFNRWNKKYPAGMADNGALFFPVLDLATEGAGSRIVMGKVAIASSSGGGGGGGTTAPAMLLLVLGSALLRRRMAR